MVAASRNSRGVAGVRVLDADPDLADVLEEHELEEARYSLVAPSISLSKGDWCPRQAVPDRKGHLGVLVTEGILCREVVIGDSVCAELVGPGDLLRPWDAAGASVVVSSDVRWHVLEEARLAVLGRSFATVAARWPALTSALVARAVSRSHALALSATISCTTGLETRLLMLFWHMADRWGRVRRDGVVVPVSMTHELIGRLIGARRPSVSTALKRLEHDALITRLHGGGWLLTGDPPTGVMESRRHNKQRDRQGSAEPTAEVAVDCCGPAELEFVLERRTAATGDRRRVDARQHRHAARTGEEPGRITPAPAVVGARAGASTGGVRVDHPRQG